MLERKFEAEMAAKEGKGFKVNNLEVDDNSGPVSGVGWVIAEGVEDSGIVLVQNAFSHISS